MKHWLDVCVVGIGGHARTKLIPAIIANGQRLAGVVSRREQSDLGAVTVFSQLEDALAALPRETLFLLSTPPAVHCAQAETVLRASRDCLIEKPAFVNVAEMERCAALARATGVVLVEGFMYRHSLLTRRLGAIWAQRRSEISGIELDFIVPQLPTGTFRSGKSITSSSLYDIGCYPLSLIADLGLPLSSLDLSELVENADGERITLRGEGLGSTIVARFGVGRAYENAVSLRLGDGQAIRFAPFFYGRSGTRTIQFSGGDELVDEGDAFQAMLAVPRVDWLASQEARFVAMASVTAALERLGQMLSQVRQGGY